MTAADPLAAWDAAEDVGVVAATGRYTSPAWTCMRCEQDYWTGSPEDGCVCGFHQEVHP